MSAQNTAVSDALEKAINFEEEGREFYLKASASTKNPMAKKAFASIAEDENKHIARIKDIYQRLQGGGALPATSEVGPQKFEIKTIFASLRPEGENIVHTPSDLEAFKFASELEVEGRQMYEGLAAAAEEPSLKAFFEALATEEQVHREIFDNAHHYLSDPEGWFALQERHIYEGG